MQMPGTSLSGVCSRPPSSCLADEPPMDSSRDYHIGPHDSNQGAQHELVRTTTGHRWLGTSPCGASQLYRGKKGYDPPAYNACFLGPGHLAFA